MTAPAVIYAGGRAIGRRCLEHLLESGVQPVALLVPDETDADTAAMRALAGRATVLCGREFRTQAAVRRLATLAPDLIVSVHFPYLFPAELVELPRIGAFNLHPAWLPLNRGWNTPTWAIAERTTFGATLHWIDEGTDTGDIVMRRELTVQPDDTADSLYGRVLALEEALFREALPLLVSGRPPREPQRGRATSHRKRDLERLRRLELDAPTTVRDLLDRLRALTTNRPAEAAYFEIDGTRYRVHVSIERESST